ncbi:hypothetical protein BD414DRAFT_414669 [Trametes punicea]|nr:hypothetical protein BD414DRAFT_414669 [Trametes punicea]
MGPGKVPFGAELDYFPAVRSVEFSAFGGVSWFILEKCLEYPHITSIAITNSPWTCVPAPPTSATILAKSQLANFSYVVPQWREIVGIMKQKQTNLQAAYELESQYLHLIVLSIADRAESLVLPVVTAPLQQMATMNWPRLHILSLEGERLDSALCEDLREALSHMPYLRSLSVQVSPHGGLSPPRLLRDTSDGGWLRYLQSLTIGYPNPEDAILTSVNLHLTHLSLRDFPRYYMHERYTTWSDLMDSPILSSSQCLCMLGGIDVAQLTTSDLIYRTDEAEDELLHFLALSCPLLQEIELHRYRASPEDDIPYLRIARLLASIRYLRAAHLNLDFSDSYAESWTNEFYEDQARDALDRRAPEFVAVFERCGSFEYLALLLDTRLGGSWNGYRPLWFDKARSP